MAVKFQPVKIPQSGLSNIPVVNGQLIYCYDTGRVFVDTQVGRLQQGISTVSDSSSLPAIASDKLYFIKKSNKLVSFVNGAWKEVNSSQGVYITEHTESSFAPVDGAIYKHTIVAGETIELETANLTADRCATFELWLTMGDTVVSFSLPDNLVWISSAPSFDNINTLYALVIRWDGAGFVANMAYSKEVTA